MTIIEELEGRFGKGSIKGQATRDGIPTVWVSRELLSSVLAFLKRDVAGPFRMLYDLTAIDERVRVHRPDQPESAFTVVYHLLSYGRNADIRVKTALPEERPSLPSIVGIWPSANWYEREVWDMFGIAFKGHPDLRRILLPPLWKGHPLLKEYPARATEAGVFELPDKLQEAEQEALALKPEEFGAQATGEDTDFMFLNFGPHHPARTAYSV